MPLRQGSRKTQIQATSIRAAAVPRSATCFAQGSKPTPAAPHPVFPSGFTRSASKPGPIGSGGPVSASVVAGRDSAWARKVAAPG